MRSAIFLASIEVQHLVGRVVAPTVIITSVDMTVFSWYDVVMVLCWWLLTLQQQRHLHILLLGH